MRLIRLSLPALVLAAVPLQAQVSSRSEALEEIRSLEVRVELAGGDAVAQAMARDLETLLLQELERVGIIQELPEPRGGDCCVLRLDVRLGPSRGGGVYGTGYSLRLDLGYSERVGRLDAWILLWQSRVLAGVADPRELTEVLRAWTRELAVDFTDRYRERFPYRR